MDQKLLNFIGSDWSGEGELWQDPLGNNAKFHKCQLRFVDTGLDYSWNYDDELVHGKISFNDDTVTWIDGWHQKDGISCSVVAEAWGLLTLFYEYGEEGSPKWGWRIKLAERPDGTLVLQMTNIAPWGEEGRAVRMVFSRA